MDPLVPLLLVRRIVEHAVFFVAAGYGVGENAGRSPSQPHHREGAPVVSYSCPQCHCRLNVPELSADAWVGCPQCGLLFVPSDCGPGTSRTTSEPVLTVMAAEEDRPRRRRNRRRDRRDDLECPYCGTDEPPVVREEISQTGWILFAILLIVFFPLCFLGLFMKERVQFCRDCGARLRNLGQSRFG